MSEPSLICSAPEIANSAQRIALYTHYAAAVAGFAGGGVMLSRIRVQEKVPHILCAVAAFGMGLAALYSQYMYDLYLYKCLEHAANAVVLRAGLWALWGALMFVGLSLTPGFRFKKMGMAALAPLIALLVGAAVTAALGDWFSASKMQLIAVPEEALRNYGAALETMKTEAGRYSLALGIPSIVCVLLAIGAYVFSQTGKPDPKLGKWGQNYQDRTGVMMMVAVLLPTFVYGVGTFLIASGAQGIDKAVLLFNCAEVLSIFFMLCASMSLVGVPANFPRPKKPEQKKNAPASADAPNVLNQQQAYAQAYAQQLYAQQQAYAAYQQQQAQYYAQQQALAAQQQQTQATVVQQATASSVPATGTPVATPQQSQQQAAPATTDPAAYAAYQQQQAQYYAQQQAYAAYQQQQQAYQQQYAAQQQYAQPQQQVYAQAYAQQQAALHKNQAARTGSAPHPARAPKVVQAPQQKGGVRKIKKIR